MVLQQIASFLEALKSIFTIPVIKVAFYSIIAIIIGIIIVILVDMQLKKLTERNVISPAASDKIRRAVNASFLIFLFLVLLYIATSSNVLLVIVLLGLAAGFAASWRVIENIIDHYAIILSRHIAQGEHVEINGVKGRIKSIDLMHTIIRSDDGSLVVIPNNVMLSSMVKHVGMERSLNIRLKLSVSNPNDLNSIEEKIGVVLATRFKHAPRTGEYNLFIEDIDASSVTYKLITTYLGGEGREIVASSLIRQLYEGLLEYEPKIELIRKT